MSEIEMEIIFLKAIQELIDQMINHEMLDITGKDPYSEIRFKSSTHQRLFNIMLVDFLSKSDKNVVGEKLSYLDAVKKICDIPHFNVDGSIDELSTATQEFTEWLVRDVEVYVWLSLIEMETMLSIKRIEFLKICGNISKHNFSRLSAVAKELVGIFKRNNIEINFEDALLILNDFYERFHADILEYHSSTIAEFLNNIRWGIHNYLEPEYLQSVVYESNDSPMYRYTFPTGVEGKFARNAYWELMNEIRSGPYVKKFKVTRYLKLRY